MIIPPLTLNTSQPVRINIPVKKGTYVLGTIFILRGLRVLNIWGKEAVGSGIYVLHFVVCLVLQDGGASRTAGVRAS